MVLSSNQKPDFESHPPASLSPASILPGLLFSILPFCQGYNSCVSYFAQGSCRLVVDSPLAGVDTSSKFIIVIVAILVILVMIVMIVILVIVVIIVIHMIIVLILVILVILVY